MRPKVGLALGSGGARGLAHLGVIKALQEANIPIDYIAGTSMGAIVGAMYAQTPNIEAITARFISFMKSEPYSHLGLKLLKSQNGNEIPSLISQFAKVIAKQIVITVAQARQGIIKSERLQSAIEYLIADGDIQETKIPFWAVASDLNSGETVVFKKGNIREAVLVSASIPGYIAPYCLDKFLLVDGAVTAPIPVQQVREMGADLVIGVDVGIRNLNPLSEPNILDILTRVDTLRGLALAKIQLSQADVAIQPDVQNAHWSEFDRYQDFIQAGYKSAREQIPMIKEKLYKKKGIFWRFLPREV